MKVNVTGNAGAGKSTLAREIAEALSLPLYHLDAVYWEAGWTKRPAARREVVERQLLAQPTWVIDGASARVRRVADLVVFLDVPGWVCLVRTLSRTVQYRSSTRPGLPQDCPEWRMVPKTIRFISRFPTDVGAAIRSEARDQPHKFLIASHPIDADELIRELLRRTSRHGTQTSSI